MVQSSCYVALYHVCWTIITLCVCVCVHAQPSYTFEVDGVEADDNVMRLSNDLKNIDLVMVAVLSQDKYRYLFEGVGHLVAAIFISSTNEIRAINTNGIKKM